MADVFQEIKTALIKSFKGKFPNYDVFCDEITKTDESEESQDLEDWIFLDLTPAGNTTVSAYHTDRRVLVDAAIHAKSETNADYLAIMPSVDALIRPVFRFGDRAITVNDMEFRVVDSVLHAIFTIAFRDSWEEPEPQPFMEELETGTNII